MDNSHQVSPVLSLKEARELEKSLLEDANAEWSAMELAGSGIAEGILRDYFELKPLPDAPRVLVLVGKGHNGGDALLAAAEIMLQHPRSNVVCLLSTDPELMKPLARRALEAVEGRVSIQKLGDESSLEWLEKLDAISGGKGFDICLDGLLGMSYKAPLEESLSRLIQAVNDYSKIGMRAAVDMPSGLSQDNVKLGFLADFTYATGAIKKVHLESAESFGRVRWVDLGFFEQVEVRRTKEYFLTDSILNSQRSLRPSMVDKRNFGHLFIVGGSSNMPGALLMSVQSAVRSGVGRVTAFAPESVAASLAAQVPEAMWIPWPESENGTLSPRALPLLLQRLPKATAVLMGPGMGRDRNTEQLAQEIISQVVLPIICDADALGLRVIELVQKRKAEWGSVVLTPHMGEFMLIAGLARPTLESDFLLEFCRKNQVVLVLKSPQTRCCDGASIYCNTFGGAVLSRGGSGDLLAGLIGGNLAQAKGQGLESATKAVVWHGKAAEALARDRGQVAVRTTEVLNYLPKILRGD
ncbi:MAG: Bifunctional NAD(P)H-hydrate repair enzyme Nnr [Opitutia bacterium UBA7350]|nr:MAG: Bifunctional NAD(P)H-hydrate repair enzyme Nnr [Opitutae bacterium UBA7350]